MFINPGVPGLWVGEKQTTRLIIVISFFRMSLKLTTTVISKPVLCG